MQKTHQRDTERAAINRKVASICGVSVRQVRRVIKGECENEEVMSVYMFLLEGDNKLIQEIKKLVPFETNK